MMPRQQGPLLPPAQGYVSSASYAGKRPTFLLSINARAVECTPLRRALEATYSALLPKVHAEGGGVGFRH